MHTLLSLICQIGISKNKNYCLFFFSMYNFFMKKIICLITLLGVFFFAPEASYAQESETKSFEGVELLTGYTWGKLQQKGNYNMAPFMLDLDFNLKPFLRKLNINPSPLAQFQIEPFFCRVFQPERNTEAGLSFSLKFGLLPQASKFQPYIKAGPGIVYITQQTKEQGSQFNFIEFIGAGGHFFFQKNTALTLEYRFRHLSNNSIKKPNRGFETHFALLGICYKF